MADRSYEISVRAADWANATRGVRDYGAATKVVGRDLTLGAERAASAWTKAADAQAAASAKATAGWIADADKRARASEASATRAARAAAREAEQELRIWDRDRKAREAALKDTGGGGGFGSRLSTAIRSTRFGAGGVSPLIGRSLDVFGMGEAAGPVAAVTGALLTLADVTRTAAEHLNELGNAARLGGGGAGDVGAVTRFGFRGPDAANAFRGRLTDPMAQMFASRLGVPITPPEPFGTVNNTALLRTAAEGLSKITNMEERLRAARVLGLEPALRYIDVSKRLGGVLDEQARIEKTLADPGRTKAANEFAIASEAAAKSWEQLAAAFGKPFMDTATLAAVRLTTALDDMAKWFSERFPGPGRPDQMEKALFGDPQALNPLLKMLGMEEVGGRQGGAHGSETADNTDALRDLNHTFRTALSGPTGGGPRARGMMPTAWTGQVLDRALEAGAIRRGATTLRP